jgi:6-phosphogluconolactonase (cycloisomerase 2 family)
VGHAHSHLSRRTILTGIASLSVASGWPAIASALQTGKRMLAFVGTDTVPVDGAANGKGIYLFEVDAVTGGLKLVKLAAETASPSWLCLHPSRKYLYAVNEVSDYHGKSGSISAFAIDNKTAELRHLNTVSSQGAEPAHMSIDATGKFAFVANYSGGSIAVFAIQQDGSLSEATEVHRDEGSLGPVNAMDAPSGSFAISGHDAPHAHMIQADPLNLFVLQTDLGQDRIYVYRLNSETGKLTPAHSPFVSVQAGYGPRHFAFHPNGRWMYSIQEEASTLIFFHYDPQAGALTAGQTISALPPGFAGTNFCSEIMVAPDGRFLYAANRLHNSIATFSISGTGNLAYVDDTPTQGDYPSNMVMAPEGRFLYVCNQRSDQITSFRVNKQTGRLAFTGKYQPLGTPMCMVLLEGLAL